MLPEERQPTSKMGRLREEGHPRSEIMIKLERTASKKGGWEAKLKVAIRTPGKNSNFTTRLFPTKNLGRDASSHQK